MTNGLGMSSRLLNEAKANAMNKYGIVMATLVIKTNLSKNSEADSPPNDTHKIKTIAITA